MFRNYRNWIILSLTIFSIVSISAHRLDLFQTRLDLLSAKNNTAMFAVNSEDIEQSLNIDKNEFFLTCAIKKITELNFCAFSILLSQTGEFIDYVNGQDLTIYQSLAMDIDYEGPAENPNLKVSFRNHNTDYVKDGDYTSLKYNSFVFKPSHNRTFKTLLSSFSVDEWWILQHNIQAKDAKLDFSNIAYIEVLPNVISQVADYEITIRKLALEGELISESTLLFIILMLWLLVVLTLIIQSNSHLQHLATTDMLTNIMNRRGLSEWVTNNINGNYYKSQFTCFYIDLDDFKSVNDKHGHHIGDELLCSLCFRVKDTLNSFHYRYRFARLAGDEFCIVFIDIPSDATPLIAKQVINSFNQPIDLPSCSVNISASVGISSTTQKTRAFEGLINHADMAMYYAKKQGKNQFKIFDKSIAKDIYYRKDISNKIIQTLNNDGFHLNFMPIYRCANKKMVKAEVLLRSNGEHLKGIGPDTFIPIAEEFHLIHDIDMWVIENSFVHINQHKNMFISQGFVFCINISAIELINEYFPKKLKDLIEKYDISPSLIELEITETSLIDANKQSIAALELLKRMGFKIALDDFGTGYTAFNQLIHYPVNCLKIDKSFIDGLTENNKIKSTMIKAMLTIADSYGLETVAEGIETEEQLSFMQNNRCDMAQGYLLSKPVSFEELLMMIKQT